MAAVSMVARDPSRQPATSQQVPALRRVQLLSRQLISGASVAPRAPMLAASPASTSPAPPASPVLTAEHWKSWRERGYIVLEQAVPQANVQRLRDEVYAFLGATADDPDSWYKFEGGMMRSGVGSEARARAGATRMDTTLNMWQTQGQW